MLAPSNCQLTVGVGTPVVEHSNVAVDPADNKIIDDGPSMITGAANSAEREVIINF